MGGISGIIVTGAGFGHGKRQLFAGMEQLRKGAAGAAMDDSAEIGIADAKPLCQLREGAAAALLHQTEHLHDHCLLPILLRVNHQPLGHLRKLQKQQLQGQLLEHLTALIQCRCNQIFQQIFRLGHAGDIKQQIAGAGRGLLQIAGEKCRKCAVLRYPNCCIVKKAGNQNEMPEPATMTWS